MQGKERAQGLGEERMGQLPGQIGSQRCGMEMGGLGCFWGKSVCNAPVSSERCYSPPEPMTPLHDPGCLGPPADSWRPTNGGATSLPTALGKLVPPAIIARYCYRFRSAWSLLSTPLLSPLASNSGLFLKQPGSCSGHLSSLTFSSTLPTRTVPSSPPLVAATQRHSDPGLRHRQVIIHCALSTWRGGSLQRQRSRIRWKRPPHLPCMSPSLSHLLLDGDRPANGLPV